MQPCMSVCLRHQPVVTAPNWEPRSLLLPETPREKPAKTGFAVIKPPFGAEDEEEEKGEFDLRPPFCSQIFHMFDTQRRGENVGFLGRSQVSFDLLVLGKYLFNF